VRDRTAGGRPGEDQAAFLEEMTTTGEQVAKQAAEIEARIGDITEETAQQRDAIDEMVDYLGTLTAGGTVDRDDDTVSTATSQVDEATSR
jgi:methyl-accepting chemotaxis protein